MADVTLKLVADNAQYIQKMKEAQNATQKVSDTAASVQKEIKALFDANKMGFSDTDKMNAYTKQMEALKKRLQELQPEQAKVTKATEEMGTASGKVEKSGGSLVASMKNWAMGFASFASCCGYFKKGFSGDRGGTKNI